MFARPGDSFYAYTVSSITGKSVTTILELFSGRSNWEEVTNELGIKPGKKEFNELKETALSGIGKVKGITRLSPRP